MPEFYMILARKITKHPNFYDICPKTEQNSGILHEFCPKNARILHNNCPKNIFPRILGEGRARAPCTLSRFKFIRYIGVGDGGEGAGV